MMLPGTVRSQKWKNGRDCDQEFDWKCQEICEVFVLGWQHSRKHVVSSRERREAGDGDAEDGD